MVKSFCDDFEQSEKTSFVWKYTHCTSFKENALSWPWMHGQKCARAHEPHRIPWTTKHQTTRFRLLSEQERVSLGRLSYYCHLIYGSWTFSRFETCSRTAKTQYFDIVKGLVQNLFTKFGEFKNFDRVVRNFDGTRRIFNEVKCHILGIFKKIWSIKICIDANKSSPKLIF